MISFHRIPTQAILFVLGTAAAALCIDFSRYHEMQHADALLPIMVSLYKWDMFYWGQSRLGMLLPALATPFEHPFWNLIVQNGLGIFGCLAAMGCVSWYLLRDRSWAVVGAIAALLFIVVFPEMERFHNMNGSQPYAIPLALATLSITMVSHRGRRPVLRWTVAGILTALAYWYHFGIGTQIALLAGGRFLYERLFTSEIVPTEEATGRYARLMQSRGVFEFACATVLTAFGSAVGTGLMNLSPHPQPHMGLTDPSLWGTGWATLFEGLASRFGSYFGYLGIGGMLGVIWLILPATRASAIRCWGLFGVVAGWLFLQFAMAGTLQWVNYNDYDIRYLYPGLISMVPATAIVAVVPLLTRYPKANPFLTAGLAIVLPFAAMHSYGTPSVAAARAAVDRATGHHTKDLLESGCTHVVGDYWPVWAATFHANMTLADRGEPAALWAVTIRGNDAMCCWPKLPPSKIRMGCVVPPGSPPTRPKIYEWGWAFEEIYEVETRGVVTVYGGR
jgi:phage tail protein X